MVSWRTRHPVCRCRSLAVLAIALVLTLAACKPSAPAAAGSGRSSAAAGVIEADVKSDFSHIRVRRHGNIRSLLFVRDHGEEVVESMANLKKPHDLLVPYTRFMFASYLWRPKQQQVLMVGLGGGAMVHFLRHYDPAVQVDAVEIDPAIVKIADEYFEMRSGGNVKIITADGVQFLEKTETRYDAIYLDAFLKPAADTDSTGMPLRMKTERFYKEMQGKLKPDGVVVVNLNPHSGTQSDLEVLRKAFPQTYVFRIAETNLIVVGSTSQLPETLATLRIRARDADQRFKTGWSFQEMLKHLGR